MDSRRLPVELICRNSRPPHGVLTRRDVLGDGEIQTVDGRAVTTPERTAFDIGRRGAVRSAVVRLDALARATGFKVDDVLCVAACHPGARRRQLEIALELVDSGAQSPRESYLRLLLIDAGFPRPRSQIAVSGADGMPIAYLDLGWEDYMVAVEYDGDHHQRDRQQYVKDIRRIEMLEQLGWIVIRVVAEDRPQTSCVAYRRRWRSGVRLSNKGLPRVPD